VKSFIEKTRLIVNLSPTEKQGNTLKLLLKDNNSQAINLKKREKPLSLIPKVSKRKLNGDY
jgi:hypothetical protein